MLLDESRFPALIEAVGAPLRLVAVAVRDTNKPHPGVPAELLTSDALSVATRDDVDLLVELAGGVDDAYRYVRAALESGDHNTARAAFAATQQLRVISCNLATIPASACHNNIHHKDSASDNIHQVHCSKKFASQESSWSCTPQIQDHQLACTCWSRTKTA
jgi:hypothetical protein